MEYKNLSEYFDSFNPMKYDESKNRIVRKNKGEYQDISNIDPNVVKKFVKEDKIGDNLINKNPLKYYVDFCSNWIHCNNPYAINTDVVKILAEHKNSNKNDLLSFYLTNVDIEGSIRHYTHEADTIYDETKFEQIAMSLATEEDFSSKKVQKQFEDFGFSFSKKGIFGTAVQWKPSSVRVNREGKIVTAEEEQKKNHKYKNKYVNFGERKAPVIAHNKYSESTYTKHQDNFTLNNNSDLVKVEEERKYKRTVIPKLEMDNYENKKNKQKSEIQIKLVGLKRSKPKVKCKTMGTSRFNRIAMKLLNNNKQKNKVGSLDKISIGAKSMNITYKFNKFRRYNKLYRKTRSRANIIANRMLRSINDIKSEMNNSSIYSKSSFGSQRSVNTYNNNYSQEFIQKRRKQLRAKKVEQNGDEICFSF